MVEGLGFRLARCYCNSSKRAAESVSSEVARVVVHRARYGVSDRIRCRTCLGFRLNRFSVWVFGSGTGGFFINPVL